MSKLNSTAQGILDTLLKDGPTSKRALGRKFGVKVKTIDWHISQSLKGQVRKVEGGRGLVDLVSVMRLSQDDTKPIPYGSVSLNGNARHTFADAKGVASLFVDGAEQTRTKPLDVGLAVVLLMRHGFTTILINDKAQSFKAEVANG